MTRSGSSCIRPRSCMRSVRFRDGASSRTRVSRHARAHLLRLTLSGAQRDADFAPRSGRRPDAKSSKAPRSGDVPGCSRTQAAASKVAPIRGLQCGNEVAVAAFPRRAAPFLGIADWSETPFAAPTVLQPMSRELVAADEASGATSKRQSRSHEHPHRDPWDSRFSSSYRAILRRALRRIAPASTSGPAALRQGCAQPESRTGSARSRSGLLRSGNAPAGFRPDLTSSLRRRFGEDAQFSSEGFTYS